MLGGRLSWVAGGGGKYWWHGGDRPVTVGWCRRKAGQQLACSAGCAGVLERKGRRAALHIVFECKRFYLAYMVE